MTDNLSKIRNALKPCPFCGGKAERIDIYWQDDPNYGGSFIHCPECLASSKLIFGEKVGLEEAWNRRSLSAPDAKEGQRERVQCEITAGEYPDRISVKPPTGTFERGLVKMGAMVDIIFQPAAPAPDEFPCDGRLPIDMPATQKTYENRLCEIAARYGYMVKE